MSDLSKHKEITDLNFDGEAPHLAICHHTQGYSANMRPDALLFKSETQVNTEVLKSLEGVVGEKELIKMSMENKRRKLESAIEDAIKGDDEDRYLWVSISDFTEDMVAFYYEGNQWAVSYQEDGAGFTFTTEPVKVDRKDLYVDSETGEELIKAADWLKVQNPTSEQEEEKSSEGDETGEANEGDPVESPSDNQSEDKEDTMSEENKVEGEVIVKSQAELDELIKAASAVAVTEALEKQASKDAEQALLKATKTELVKCEHLPEEGMDTLVKALVANEDHLEVIVKAFSELNKANEELKAENARIVKEFGEKQESEESEISIEKGGETANLKELVKARKASRK
jgi:uncharacterized protein YggU (UPF0235/DUF167 family)